MAELFLEEEFEEIDLFCNTGLYAYLHTVRVDTIDYGILYIPVDAGFFGHSGLFEQELGRSLPSPSYEIKFALKRDFDGGAPSYTTPRSHPDLGDLTYGQLMALGAAVYQSTWMFRHTRRVSGFVAIAIEERPKLAAYYRRLLKKYQGQLHFDVHLVQGGNGYAIY